MVEAVEVASFIMSRRMLHGIKTRAEGRAQSQAGEAGPLGGPEGVP